MCCRSLLSLRATWPRFVLSNHLPPLDQSIAIRRRACGHSCCSQRQILFLIAALQPKHLSVPITHSPCCVVLIDEQAGRSQRESRSCSTTRRFLLTVCNQCFRRTMCPSCSVPAAHPPRYLLAKAETPLPATPTPRTLVAPPPPPPPPPHHCPWTARPPPRPRRKCSWCTDQPTPVIISS